MTVICGGGTSGPNIGVDLALTYSAGRLAQLLVAAGLSELSAWLPLVGLIPVVLSGFCSTDPPAMVALTQAESDALANNTFGSDFVNGLGKFKDVLLNLIWLDVCHCTSGSLTTPAVPAVDANTPVFVSPATPTITPCFTLNGGTFTIGPNTSFAAVAGPTALPPGCTSYYLRTTHTGATPAFDQVSIFDGPDTNFANAAWRGVSWAPGGVYTAFQGPNVPVQNRFFWIVQRLNTQASVTATARIEFYCGGGTPGGPGPQPCCPPDASTQAYLDLILKQVTLIQRQNAPFGYIPGTVHSGLSGTGSIGIQGLIGAKVDVTTLPGSYGRAGTDPTQYFDLGFLSFGTPDGWPTSYRLDHDPYLMFPQRCGLYTQFDYDLAPGVAVTMTELKREP